MRKIIIATVGRSDYGLCEPVMDRIAADPSLTYGLLVSGAHLSEKSGFTITEIEARGRPIVAKIKARDTFGRQAEMAAATGEILTGCAAVFAENRPDILVVLGDRFEMFAIAAAAVPFNIPIAHIHGGELSFGAIDDVLRHAITKMSHLHFASTREYADRIIRMGEDPARVFASGAPGLDNIRPDQLPSRADLTNRFGIPLDDAPIMVTFHPVTRQFEEAERQVAELLAALRTVDVPIVITAPNADAGSETIRRALRDFVDSRDKAWLVESFGSLNYLAMLREARAMVGNSSSGIVEAPSFGLPTVNVGDRQQGRTRAANVIDVDCQRDAIVAGIRRAIDPAFRESINGKANPYGDGHAAERIIDVLKSVELGDSLSTKRFYDGPSGSK